jgi:hypothetical protein
LFLLNESLLQKSQNGVNPGPRPGGIREVGKQALSPELTAGLPFRPQRSRNVGHKMAAVVVNHPLTMIKSTLAPPFYSIRQADRMVTGSGTVT